MERAGDGCMSSPAILVVDVETAPSKGYFWRLFDENIGLNQVIEPGRILCWAAKWVGKPEVHFADERAGRKAMLTALRDLLLDADAVVTYNGDKFDLCKIRGEMVLAGLGPLPRITSIDLIRTVRGLGFLSNRLEFVGPLLKAGAKIKHEGFPLWTACLAGDKAAWRRMRRYNEQDVRLTERAYKALRPYMLTHPRFDVLDKSRPTCKTCGSSKIQLRGWYYTQRGQSQRFVCHSCGGWDHMPARRVL